MRRVALWVGAFALAAAAVPAAAQLSSAELRAAAAARDAAAAERASRSSGTGKGVRYFGPAEPENRYQPRLPAIGEAPAQLKYMSPRCSALNDALRTANARGLHADTVAVMRKDYGRECAEDEDDARSALSEEMRDRAKQKRDAQQSEKQSREQASLRAEQCGESKRILLKKRARTDLTEGEKAELQRFEVNYRSRCG